jgi:hypothetical protein
MDQCTRRCASEGEGGACSFWVGVGSQLPMKSLSALLTLSPTLSPRSPTTHLQNNHRSFLALFTRKALSMYVRQQDTLIRAHVGRWLELAAAGSPEEMRLHVWKMNAETSRDVFVGERSAGRLAGRLAGGSHQCFLYDAELSGYV